VDLDQVKNTFEEPWIDLDGKTMFVTGGTGSFGRAFVAAVLERFKPRKLIIFSRDELKQYEMQQDPVFQGQDCLRFFIGDVRDVDRLEMAMRDVDYVVHAAALKQVPAAEYNPFECVRTNINGAENVATAAIRTGVERVIALSTDKAVSPVNLYGASKLASDKIFVAANNLSGDGGTRFSVVRYGNVLGSRGSVVPLYRRLIRDGATSLPVTDERMTRFWITLADGVGFVLGCLNIMQGGEIYVPSIPSMKVVDVALAMAPDLPHEVIGIRPGEKLHESLITEDDARNTLAMSGYYVVAQNDVENRLDDHYRGLGGEPVGEGFRYSSDNNENWLDGSTFLELLGDGAA
jgi:UDP-N-acetylglucosamine 4,6-dehydratase